jgi:hypothetical protein
MSRHAEYAISMTRPFWRRPSKNPQALSTPSCKPSAAIYNRSLPLEDQNPFDSADNG